MRRKRLLSGCLAAVLCTTMLAGCGSSSENVSVVVNGEKSESVAASTEVQDENSSTADGQKSETAESTSGSDSTSVSDSGKTAENVGQSYASISGEDLRKDSIYQNVPGSRQYSNLFYYHQEYLEVNSTKYPALDQTLFSYQTLRNAEIIDYQNENLDYLAEWEAESEDFYGGSYYLYTSVYRADDKYFSFVEDMDIYMGGAHGSRGRQGYTLNTQTGEELVIGDVFSDVEAAASVIAAEFRTQYQGWDFEDYISYTDMTLEQFIKSKLESKETISEIGADENWWPSLTWYIDTEGVYIFASAETFGPYAFGPSSIYLRASEYPDLFALDFSEKPTAYTIPLYTGENQLDVDQDGAADILKIDGEQDYNWYMTLRISCNGESAAVSDVYSYSFNPYLAIIGDKVFLYVETNTDNDWRSVYIFEIADKRPVYRGMVENEGFSDELFLNPESFRLEGRTSILSTSGIRRTYHVGDDGMPVAETEWYDIIPYTDLELLTKTEVPAEILPETATELSDTPKSGEAGTIPSGTPLNFMRTDNQTKVDLIAANGMIYRVVIDDADAWPRTVQGIDIDDLFDGVMFAG